MDKLKANFTTYNEFPLTSFFIFLMEQQEKPVRDNPTYESHIRILLDKVTLTNVLSYIRFYDEAKDDYRGVDFLTGNKLQEKGREQIERIMSTDVSVIHRFISNLGMVAEDGTPRRNRAIRVNYELTFTPTKDVLRGEEFVTHKGALIMGVDYKSDIRIWLTYVDNTTEIDIPQVKVEEMDQKALIFKVSTL